MNNVDILKWICIVGDLCFNIHSGFYPVQEILGRKYGLLIDAFCTVPSRHVLVFRHVTFLFLKIRKTALFWQYLLVWLESVSYKYFIECIVFCGIVPQSDGIRIQLASILLNTGSVLSLASSRFGSAGDAQNVSGSRSVFLALGNGGVSDLIRCIIPTGYFVLSSVPVFWSTHFKCPSSVTSRLRMLLEMLLALLKYGTTWIQHEVNVEYNNELGKNWGRIGYELGMNWRWIGEEIVEQLGCKWWCK